MNGNTVLRVLGLASWQGCSQHKASMCAPGLQEGKLMHNIFGEAKKIEYGRSVFKHFSIDLSQNAMANFLR